MSEQAIPEAQLKAFEFAQEATKQLLTLATGIFALTFTFLNEIVDTKDAQNVIEWLHRAWVLYIVSIAFGLMTLMMLTGNLVNPHGGGEPTIYGGNIKWTAILQFGTFGAALVLTLIFGIKAI